LTNLNKQMDAFPRRHLVDYVEDKIAADVTQIASLLQDTPDYEFRLPIRLNKSRYSSTHIWSIPQSL